MPVLTYLTEAVVKSNVRTLNGKIVSRPTLLTSDGINPIYVCDVDIGLSDPNSLVVYDIDYENPTGLLESALKTILRNVPVSRANYELMYADVGNPVNLTRTASGNWEITGFSQEMPGNYHRVAVDLGDMTIGTIQDLSIVGRLLTLGELGTYGIWGSIPFGASGLFLGGVFQKLVI